MSLKASIIIVTYGARSVVRDCFESVQLENDGSLEVIVIDNASPDGTAEMITKEFPTIHLVANSTNVGFSPANNQGMALATAPMIMLLNPDTVVRPGGISQWIEAHRSSGATISGPRLLNVDGSLQPSAWKVPGLWNSLLELFSLHRISGVGRYALQRFATDFEPGFVSGAAMLFHRKVFEGSGGLDPEMFWMEDVDLCVRVRGSGGRVQFLHGPEIVHLGGESSKKNMDRVISNQLISRIKFARKHSGVLSIGGLIVVIYVHVITRTLAFGLVGMFRNEPRSQAYRFTFNKLGRYLFKNDRSI